MATQNRIRKPNNKEIHSGDPFVRFGIVEGANIKNGRLVIAGTNADDIKVATNEVLSALGWVIRDKTNPMVRESDRTTDYTAGELVAFAHGDACILVGYCEGACNEGSPLVPGTAGAVKPDATDDESAIVGYAQETIASAGFILIKPNI